MTLEQVRDWLITEYRAKQTGLFAADAPQYKACADTIDMHLVGMGEPVAWMWEHDFLGRGIDLTPPNCPHPDYTWTPFYAAPPIDLAAVRETIMFLRGYSNTSDLDLADKLEAAIKGGA